jgi:hypothetical protein
MKGIAAILPSETTRDLAMQEAGSHWIPQEDLSRGKVLTKACLRAGENLQLPSRVLANILGVSEATVSRMRAGEYVLKETQKPYELAALFVRLYRSLDALVGGDDAVAAKWLKGQNTALNGVPLEMIQSVSGLLNVITYLDARRAVI